MYVRDGEMDMSGDSGLGGTEKVEQEASGEKERERSGAEKVRASAEVTVRRVSENKDREGATRYEEGADV